MSLEERIQALEVEVQRLKKDMRVVSLLLVVISLNVFLFG